MQQRLQENADAIGADEMFFEDQDAATAHVVYDLFNEKAGILDDDADDEVDLASFAYQVWKNAIDRDGSLENTIKTLPDVVYSTRSYSPTAERPEGSLVYLRTAEGNDALAWIDSEGRSVTESQFDILKAAACEPNTPTIAPHQKHHEMVDAGIKLITETEKTEGGQLGNRTSPRRRTYERLKNYAEETKGTFFKSAELNKAIDDLYKYPLLTSARDTLQRRRKNGISNAELAELVITLNADGRLSQITENSDANEPQLICSMGLMKAGNVAGIPAK